MSNLIFTQMLQVTLIGNIGANAEIKNSDGREFVTFRVAHNESYTAADGQKVEKSAWVDVTMNCSNGRPAVLPYLVKGALVFVTGNVSLRAYSSEKDRCWKAGMTIHCQNLGLLGGQTDPVPRRLFTKAGVQIDVEKYYHVNTDNTELLDSRGNVYTIDSNGWVGGVQSKQEDNGND